MNSPETIPIDINPDEAYEITVIDAMSDTVSRLLEEEREPSEATYIALAHKVTSALLEREGAHKYEDGSFDIKPSTTFETGEFDLIPDLFQKVPVIAQKALELTVKDKESVKTSEDITMENMLHRELLVFIAHFEDLIEEDISKELEDK